MLRFKLFFPQGTLKGAGSRSNLSRRSGVNMIMALRNGLRVLRHIWNEWFAEVSLELSYTRSRKSRVQGNSVFQDDTTIVLV